MRNMEPNSKSLFFCNTFLYPRKKEKESACIVCRNKMASGKARSIGEKIFQEFNTSMSAQMARGEASLYAMQRGQFAELQNCSRTSFSETQRKRYEAMADNFAGSADWDLLEMRREISYFQELFGIGN